MTCQPCPPGTHVKPPCTDTTPSCVACIPGRYNPGWTRAIDCRPCKRHCHGYDEIPKKPCRRLHDLQCGCRSGSWHYKPNTKSSKCLPLRVCDSGFGVTIPGTNVSDVTCGECIKGETFSDVRSSFAGCKPCTQCQDLGWEELQACTTVSDAACNIITTESPKPNEEVSANPASRQPIRISNQTSPTDQNTIILSSAAAVIIVLVILGIVLYRYRRRIGKQSVNIKRKDVEGGEHGSQEPLNPGGSPEVVVKYTKASSNSGNVCRRRSSTVAPSGIDKIGLDKGPRSPSLLKMDRMPPFPPSKKREGVDLVDIFIWVAANHGLDGFQSFLLALPSEAENGRLTKAEIEAIEYEHGRNLQTIIREGLEKWRDKNAEKTEDEVLVDIFETLSKTNKYDLAEQLSDQFADHPVD
ncbi:tumor necrosis factor receptor superfamily member 21-like [Lineus longissimus]|uniref:tumor necrosis factor receptor superfamily member 21-like n=1 Tax=Lineus longissimus TaxID=88925 RepID=UPI00315C7F9C